MREPFQNFFKTGKNVLWLYKPFWRYEKLFVVLSLFFWAVLVPLAQYVGVYLPSTIVNLLQEKASFNVIIITVIGMQLFIMMQPMYENFFIVFSKSKALVRIDGRLRQDTYEKAKKTDYRYIDDPDYYDNYSFAVSEYGNKAREAHDLVNRIAASLVTIISMLTVIGSLSPLCVIAVVIGTTVEHIFYITGNYYDVKKDEAVVPHDRKMNYIHRIFYMGQYAADVKSTKLQEYLLRDHSDTVNGKLDVTYNFWKKILSWNLGGTLSYYFVRSFVILNIAHGIWVGDIPSVASYITIMNAVAALSDALNEMFYHVKSANKLGMYATRIRSFFEVESKIEQDNTKSQPVPVGPFSVEFDHVQFQYENSDFRIQNLNLSIRPGERVAIVGENGVGKSTMVKLLMRFYDVTGGSIRIDGHDLRDYKLAELRQKIGVAFQNPNVYALSFKDNIGLYGEIEPMKLEQIIQKTGLNKVLEKNHADISTIVTKEFDENGIMLSGGEVQKIGIARLLTGEFGLLLFDEPSAALDPLAEYEMTKLILDSSNLATTIIIAHRLSSIRHVDRIILVDDGSVCEMGTHDELMAQKGKYYEMFTKQAENYKE